MSVFQVNKLLYLTDNDPTFRQRITADPDAVLDEFHLTAEERAALTSGAVGKTKPLFLEGDEGNGYAVWKFEGGGGKFNRKERGVRKVDSPRRTRRSRRKK